jgi:hypothetical protein
MEASFSDLANLRLRAYNDLLKRGGRPLAFEYVQL